MSRRADLKRKYRLCIKFNEKELKVLDRYCKKYNITNKSRFIREAVMKAIIEKMVEEDYPKLFPEMDNEIIEQDEEIEVINDTEKSDEQRKNLTNQHPKLFE